MSFEVFMIACLRSVPEDPWRALLFASSSNNCTKFNFDNSIVFPVNALARPSKYARSTQSVLAPLNHGQESRHLNAAQT